MLDGYYVEIDELDQHHVVLVMRALRLIVLGRTFGEAQQLARAAIASRSQEDGRRCHRGVAGRILSGRPRWSSNRPARVQVQLS